MIASAKLTGKYQMTIPVAIRRRLGIEAGDVVILTVEGGQVILRAAKGGWTESSRGLGAEVWKRAGGGTAAVERERDSWA